MHDARFGDGPHPPPLAGICGYSEASRIGYTVEESVRRLLRYHWVERRLMEIGAAHLPGTPVWEVKGALALHHWYDAEHADALRTRIAEMRHPAPAMDRAPDAALDAFLDELLRAGDAIELVAGIYGVARPALLDAYREHLDETNPVVDHPTRRFLRFVVREEEEAAEWGRAALEALTDGDGGARERARTWEGHLRAYLEAAGGIAGPSRWEGERPPEDLPGPRASEPFEPRLRPRRDDRFTGALDFDFPPHAVYDAEGVPADERNLALLCKRLLEMDVPEMMASFIYQRRGLPWEFYREYARQLWDEARHSMMGEIAFEARDVDWRAIPLNVGFSLRLNLHAKPLERQILLLAIEQSLMPGDTGKRFEYGTAVEAGDELSAHIHDYDWADEVLHAQIGRRWLKAEGLSTAEALERAKEIHERTWAALERYGDTGSRFGWWDDFCREVLGRPSAVDPEALDEPAIIGE